MHIRSPIQVILAASIVVPLLVSTLLYIFAWPGHNTRPNGLPVGFVTNSTLESRLPRLLNQIQENGFDARFYPDEAAARSAIQKREIYGALLIDPTRPEDYTLLTASAGSPTVAGLLTGIGNSLGGLLSAAGFKNPKLNDVVAATTDDPRQAGLLGSALPLVISGALTAAILVFGLRRSSERLLALTLIALVTGFAITAVWQFAFGTLAGNYLSNALVASLTIGAIGSFVAGLGAVIGVRGIGIGAVTMLLISNPLSAIGSSPRLLPWIWGDIGQWLPLGAFGTLIRSVAFFNGEGGGQALLVLSLWLLVGIALVWVGSSRSAAAPRTAAA